MRDLFIDYLMTKYQQNQTFSMLQDQLVKFPDAVWVQIYKDKMQLMNIDGTITHTLLPDVPYAHPRSIIADFDAAAVTLKRLLPSSMMKKLFSSIALLQIMDLPEDGLTEVEKRALLELGYESSVQNVILFDHAGNALTKARVPPPTSNDDHQHFTGDHHYGGAGIDLVFDALNVHPRAKIPHAAGFLLR